MCYGIQFTTPGAGGSAVPLIVEALVLSSELRAWDVVMYNLSGHTGPRVRELIKPAG